MRLPYNGTFPTNQAFNDPCCRASYAQFGMQGHNGIDYGLPMGTPVIAAISGKVYVGYEAGGYGNYIFITGAGVETVYGHLQSVNVSTGQNVNEGQQIGLSNNTGNSSGPHLHFGTRPIPYNNGNGFLGYVDPLTYLKGNNMSTIATEELVNNLARAYFDDSIAHNPGLGGFIGQPIEDVIHAFNIGVERDSYLKSIAAKDKVNSQGEADLIWTAVLHKIDPTGSKGVIGMAWPDALTLTVGGDRWKEIDKLINGTPPSFEPITEQLYRKK